MNHLVFSLNAVLPIILLVLIGYILKIKKIIPIEFFTAANKLCFYLLMPVLLFFNIYQIESLTQIDWFFIGFILTAITIWFLLGLLIVIVFVKEKRQKAAVHSGIFRSNFAIIGIPLALAIAGPDSKALVLASLVIAANVPLVNAYSMITLTVFSEENTGNSKLKILAKIFLNPLTIAVFVGLIVVFFRIFILENMLNSNFTIKNNLGFLYDVLRNLANAATPLALIALGGKFSLGSVGQLKRLIFSTVFIRSVIVPGVTLTIAFFIGFRYNEFPALIALFATPVSISSVAMAQQMGADDELMGQIVVWTTVVSAFTLFAIIYLASVLYII